MIPLFKELLESGQLFEIECTNKYYNIKHSGVSYKFFAHSKTSFEVFNISRKLKNELLDNDHLDVPQYNIEEYFKTNNKCNFDFNDKFYCIDIKQAYITIMKNRGLISNELHAKICELKKPDRLKALGMIARRKSKYTYYNGKMIESEMDVLPTEKYFFWCVEQTYLLMSDIAKKISNDFIFFWVDCIFFVGERNIKYVIDRLKSERLQYTLERMRVKGISQTKTYHTFCFLKSGKMKEYNVPIVRDIDLLSKAKHCFINENFKGFKYYYKEYENVRENIS